MASLTVDAINDINTTVREYFIYLHIIYLHELQSGENYVKVIIWTSAIVGHGSHYSRYKFSCTTYYNTIVYSTVIVLL